MLHHAVPSLHNCQIWALCSACLSTEQDARPCPSNCTLVFNEKIYAFGNRRSFKDWTVQWLTRKRQPAPVAQQAQPSMLCLCAMPCDGCC